MGVSDDALCDSLSAGFGPQFHEAVENIGDPVRGLEQDPRVAAGPLRPLLNSRTLLAECRQPRLHCCRFVGEDVATSIGLYSRLALIADRG